MCLRAVCAAVREFLQSKDSEPSEDIARVWRTAHKLRLWLLQRYQEVCDASSCLPVTVPAGAERARRVARVLHVLLRCARSPPVC